MLETRCFSSHIGRLNVFGWMVSLQKGLDDLFTWYTVQNGKISIILISCDVKARSSVGGTLWHIWTANPTKYYYWKTFDKKEKMSNRMVGHQSQKKKNISSRK